MFMLRGLFWVAAVALLLPRGPDLGVEPRRAAGLPLTPSLQISIGDARAAADAVREQIVLSQMSPGDIVERYRGAVFERLAAVRVELAADRARRGDSGKLSALIPEAWRD